MNSGPADRRYTRTDLFLVRIWTKGAKTDIADVNGEYTDESISTLEWRGTVQRAVDGEAYQFNDLQGLLDLLVAMLKNNKRRLE